MTYKVFPLPGVKHGDRILTSVIEQRAQDGSEDPWVSVPVNDEDLSQGYRDISFWQLNNYANRTANWLEENLPDTGEPFQCFAYAGPKDLRYSILAVAASKLQKVIVLPSPLITPDAQFRILQAKNCSVYLRPASMADHVAEILQSAQHVQTITVPELDEFMQNNEAVPYNYPKAWCDGADDPWIVFHTSGTTGYPKPITFTHRMMAIADRMASFSNAEPSIIHHFASRRWYTPLPALHAIGTVLTLAFTAFLHTTVVVGPSAPPVPETVISILHHGRVQGALLTPGIIEDLCQTAAGLKALRRLQYVHYAGAPLAPKAGNRLIPYVPVVCAIGSTEAGAYPTALHDKRDAWDYVRFQQNAGIVFERRFEDLHELVFVRKSGSDLPAVFMVYPDLDRFETKDLWVEHPIYRELWKIVGRTDDYVAFSHADGIHASSLESDIEAHPDVKAALIGGSGRPAPVLLVELFPGTRVEGDGEQFKRSLQPYLDRVNERCHECVQLSSDRVIFATDKKPFVRTVKGSVARLQTLDLYRDEIAGLFD